MSLIACLSSLLGLSWGVLIEEFVLLAAGSEPESKHTASAISRVGRERRGNEGMHLY